MPFDNCWKVDWRFENFTHNYEIIHVLMYVRYSYLKQNTHTKTEYPFRHIKDAHL